jgi:hypothetical protein
MFFVGVLWFLAMILAVAMIVGFSQIFKLGEGIRIVWAAVILISLAVLLLAGIERALETAAIPSPTPAEEREAFFQKYVDGRPGMSREQFN